MTVRLYKVDQYEAYMADECGEGYSLDPAGPDTMYYKQEDDGGRDYVLPEGYSVGVAIDTNTYIYDPSGNPCEIVTHISGLPQLVSGLDADCPVLQVV